MTNTTITSRHLLRSGLCLIVALIVGCDDALPKNTVSTTPLSANQPLGFGRSNAIYGYLAKSWQITHINNIPTPHPAILNLTQIEQGKGSLRINQHCKPILIEFDIKLLEKGVLSTKAIERELDDCSDAFEDRLMSAISDMSHIQKKPNSDEIVLSGFQDVLLLTPTH